MRKKKKKLVSCWQRSKRKVGTTASQHQQPVAPDKLDRDFSAAAPNLRYKFNTRQEAKTVIFEYMEVL